MHEKLAYLRKEPKLCHQHLEYAENFEWGRSAVLQELEEDASIGMLKGLKSCGAPMLAGQQALLGVVTPELRAVSVDINEHNFYMQMYYDGVIAKFCISKERRCSNDGHNSNGHHEFGQGKPCMPVFF